MVNVYASFSHDFLQITIGNRITDVKENSIEDDAFGEMCPCEIDRHPHSPRSNIRIKRIIAKKRSKFCDRAELLIRERKQKLERTGTLAPLASRVVKVIAMSFSAKKGLDVQIPFENLVVASLRMRDLRISEKSHRILGVVC
jgi:hypothetical protein